MREPLFSIIIPVYNVKQYLEICVKSILVQKCKDYEIILIDDGSTDGSSEICDEFEKKYKQIRVIHKKNGGLSSARNIGTALAKGDYIIYLDSDDFILDKNYLGKIEDIIDNSSKCPDLILHGYSKYYRKNKRKIMPLPMNSELAEGSITEICNGGLFFLSAWAKIIGRKVLQENKISFREGILSEDIEWCGRLISVCNHVIAWNSTAYAYRQREGSITRTVSLKHMSDIEESIRRCENMLSSCSNGTDESLKSFIGANVSMYMIVISRQSKDTWKQKKDFISKYKKYLGESKRRRENTIYRIMTVVGYYSTIRLLSICDRLLGRLNG